MKTNTNTLKRRNLKTWAFASFVLFLFYNPFSMAQTISLQSFATGFSSPLEITNAGDSRLFVVEKGGLIKILNDNGTVNTTPFLDISSLVNTNSERGLLGLAFHPDYATNGYFFVNYSNNSGNTVIARYSVFAANPNAANPSSATILMTINQPYDNHNGGSIKFGPDGYLYIGMGDGGSGGDPQGYAQNTTIDVNNPTRVFLGKMLRIDVNATTAPFYSIPATNPYVGQTGKEEIWAIGLRNPWKFSFDSVTGDLWIADVGQGAHEEVNKTVSPLSPGLNYGWRCYEGNATYNTSGCPASSALTFPLVDVAHSTGACSITGGYVYNGTTYPNLQGLYLFTDYCDSRIGMVTTTGTLSYSSSFSGNNFVSFGEDINKELYIAAINNGTIYKITDTSLSSENFENSGFAIYPNPAKEIITLSNTNNILAKSVSIYDISGKNVLTKTINESNTINISTLAKGIYNISIIDVNDIKYNTKIVVQ